jgi:acetyl esterase/lipase
MLTTRKQFLQQTGFALAGSILPFSKLFSSTKTTVDCSGTPFNCIDLRSTLYDYAVFSESSGNGVPYANGSLPDVKYLNDEGYCTTQCTCVAPSQSVCLNNPNQLVYDVYYPSNYANFATCPLPAIILFHAGGFKECSNFREPGIMTICQELAKRGFVAFSVEYRQGRIRDPADTFKYTSVQQQLAFYRAIQDVKGAIRSIIKRQNNETTGDSFNDPYRIDISKIFIGGMSAGALAASTASWYTDNMIYQQFANSSGSTIQEALGDVNANFYYGETTIEYQSLIGGFLNMWGAVGIPYTYWTNQINFFIQTGNIANVTPLIAFHGRTDPVFPYPEYGAGQKVFFSENSGYKSETLCTAHPHGAYTIGDGSLTTPDQFNGSSLNMYNIATNTNFQKPAELYKDCTMGHGLDSNGSGYSSDFGTIAAYGSSWANTTSTYTYMAIRTAIFFQMILNNMANSLSPTIFNDCANSRYISKVSGVCGIRHSNDFSCSNTDDSCP